MCALMRLVSALMRNPLVLRWIEFTCETHVTERLCREFGLDVYIIMEMCLIGFELVNGAIKLGNDYN